MSFKKIVPKATAHGAVDCSTPVESKSITLVNGVPYESVEVTVLDPSDPSQLPEYPDPAEFNDLQRIVSSGVLPQSVNTNVIHHTDVAEINEDLELQLPSESNEE